MKRIKRLVATGLAVLFTLCMSTGFVGCKLTDLFPNEKKNETIDDHLEWTNDNIVYAYIKAGYEDDILTDVENSFPSLSFQKVYVHEKNTNVWTPLSLLFILKDSDVPQKQEFIDVLENDERINHTSIGRDLPFETVDTRYIEREKDAIAIGESLQLTFRGTHDYYVQPFGFDGFFVKPATEKQYSVHSFPGVALKSVREEHGGWLYLELEEEGYFNVVKACDKIARLPEIEMVEKARADLLSVIPPIWQVSDETIVRLETNPQNNPAVITGIKAGTVTVSFNGVKCEITVE